MRIFCLAVVVFCSMAIAQSSFVERAWKLAAGGDRKAAEGLLRPYLKSHGSDGEAHLLLGSLLAEEGDQRGSIAELLSAVRLKPRSPEAWIALGEAQRRFSNTDGAKEAFARAIALDPKSGVAESNLGAVLLEAADHDGAAVHLDRALSLLKDPSDVAEALYLRAKIEAERGNASTAVTHLQKAVALRPDFAPAWSDLGAQRKLLGDDSEALAAFERSVRLDAEDGVAQYRLGAEYLRQGKAVDALRHLEVAARLNPEDQSVLNGWILALRELGRRDEAAAVKQKLSEVLRRRDEERQNALAALKANNEGSALEKSGRLAEAVEQYREAVRLNGRHSGMRVNYAVALLRSGAWRDGLEQMRAALELDPHNSQIETALQDAIRQAPADALPEWASPQKHH